MTREEITRNLKYVMEKHKDDKVGTFDTNITLMCKDILDYLEQEPVLDKIMEEINSPNRGTCDYFIVDRIEEIIKKHREGEE